MESLALLVSLILLAIFVLGALAIFTVIRSPRSQFGKVAVGVINCATIFSGAWLALLNVGSGARFFGVLVFAAGAFSLFRLLRKS